MDTINQPESTPRPSDDKPAKNATATPASSERFGDQQTILSAAETSPTDTATEEFAFLEPAQEAGEMGWLGQYRVLKLLGQGGMGVVFLAEDTRLRRQVALKVMRPELAKN